MVLAVEGRNGLPLLHGFLSEDSRMWFFGSSAAQLRRLALKMSGPPYGIRLSLIAQEPSEMALVYTVSAGPAVDSDVVARRLTVLVNGEILSSTEHDGSTTTFGEIKVAQDSSVVVTLVDIDDAGNESQPGVIEFTATDTIAPSQPGSLGVTLVREE